jgi:DNA-binding LacI/PurR family transcriptional regulator
VAKLTIEDVAKLAGVSTATVSRAIHFPGMLRKHTLERVLKVMSEHDYIYNATAGDLSRRKSSVLGAFIPTTESAKLSATLIAVQDVVNSSGYPLIINNTLFDPDRERMQLRQCRERSLSGLVFIGYMAQNEPVILEMVRDGVPCVFLWDTMPGTEFHYVGFNNYEASYKVTRHLIDLGHRRIAFVGAMYSLVHRVRKRLEGYLGALRDYGVGSAPEYICEYQPTLDNGRVAMRRLLALDEPPSAVFCASDMLAIGAMTACRQAGLRVPLDISVAGFDDIEFAAYANPALTTLNVPSQEMGRLAGQTLIELVKNGTGRPHQHCLETTLVVRESCAPPARRRAGRD